MQATIAGPLLDAQLPPPPGLASGVGVGAGAGATLGVRKTWTTLQSPSVSASMARARRY